MKRTRNRSERPRIAKPVKYVTGLTLTLALAAGLIACGESPADPAPLAAQQAAGSTSDEDHLGGPFGPGLRLLEELGLSDEQQAEVERIQAELREKNEPLREQIQSTLGISDDEAPRRSAFREMTEEQRDALRPTFEQIRENHRAAMDEVSALLTAEQRETLDSLLAERKAHWEERRDERSPGISGRGHRGPPFADGMLRLPSDLDLTADQQAEVERIQTELREKNEPLREQIQSTLGISDDESPRRFAFREMTEEQRDALRPTFDQLRENHSAAREQVEALLTPEQREKLDSLRDERRSRGPGPRGFFPGSHSG